MIPEGNQVTIETFAEPAVVQIDPEGRLALPKRLLSTAGLHEGDQVLVLPLEAGLLYLRRLDLPEPVSREELGTLMRAAFAQAGYATREQVLDLVRAAKRETDRS